MLDLVAEYIPRKDILEVYILHLNLRPEVVVMLDLALPLVLSLVIVVLHMESTLILSWEKHTFMKVEVM